VHLICGSVSYREVLDGGGEWAVNRYALIVCACSVVQIDMSGEAEGKVWISGEWRLEEEEEDMGGGALEGLAATLSD
jgi:hypothetical protein